MYHVFANIKRQQGLGWTQKIQLQEDKLEQLTTSPQATPHFTRAIYLIWMAMGPVVSEEAEGEETALV